MDKEVKLDLQKNKIDKFWEFIKHPVTCLVIGITFTVIFFFAGKAEKVPVYTFSNPEVLAKVTNDNLKLLWNSIEIPNANSVKIGLWNQGKLQISKEDISTTNPIRIVPSENVNILDVQVLKTSRDDLNYDYFIEKNNDNQNIVVNIKGDEALEKNDGVLFHVLYSGSADCKWQVVGRVKGVPEGIGLIKWDILKTNSKISNLFKWLICLVYLPLAVHSTFLKIGKFSRTKVIVYILTMVLVIALTAYIVIPQIWNYFYYSSPSWLL